MNFKRQSFTSTALVSVLLIAAPVLGQSQVGASRSDGADSAGRGESVKLNLAASQRVASGSKQSLASGVSLSSSKSKVLVQDVVLSSSGDVTFTVVSSSGQAVVGNPVAVLVGSVRIAAAKTDLKGQVRISGLRPGMHVFQTGFTKSMVRLWPAASAPPQAVKFPAIVDASDLVRGQYGYGPPLSPGLVAATVTALGIGAVVIGKSSSSESAITADPASP